MICFELHNFVQCGRACEAIELFLCMENDSNAVNRNYKTTKKYLAKIFEHPITNRGIKIF